MTKLFNIQPRMLCFTFPSSLRYGKTGFKFAKVYIFVKVFKKHNILYITFKKHSVTLLSRGNEKSRYNNNARVTLKSPRPLPCVDRCEARGYGNQIFTRSPCHRSDIKPVVVLTRQEFDARSRQWEDGIKLVWIAREE